MEKSPETKAKTPSRSWGGFKIVVVLLSIFAVLIYLSGWLDDRVEWLCDGVWVERPNGSTECIEGAVP